MLLLASSSTGPVLGNAVFLKDSGFDELLDFLLAVSSRFLLLFQVFSDCVDEDDHVHYWLDYVAVCALVDDLCCVSVIKQN